MIKFLIINISVLFSLVIFIYSEGYSQNEDNVWLLGYIPNGNNCEINFSNNHPDTISIFNKLCFFLVDASICDTTGNLLFCTNGISIYNKNFDTLSNSQNFNPGWATNYYANSGMGIPQSLIIVPMPGGKYYLFHMSAEQLLNGETQPLNLSYSEIDMSLDSGLGGLSVKDIHLYDDTLAFGKLAACRHANGRDWWILTHTYNSDNYVKILCKPDSFYVISQQIGSLALANSDILGQTVFSPDGNTFVFAMQNNIIDIFNFDRCTGELTLRETMSASDSTLGICGAAISPNSRYLYIDNNNKLFQYDLYSSNIRNSEKLVGVWDTLFSPAATNFFLEQLGPDGKIYMSTFGGSNKLHVINNPDMPDTLCNFVQNQVTLPSYNNCLPNLPYFRLGSLPGSLCDSLNGIEELHSFHITSVYPNPATEFITVNYNVVEHKQSQVRIYNMMDEIIISINIDPLLTAMTINISNLANGIYICQMVADGLVIDARKISVIK